MFAHASHHNDTHRHSCQAWKITLDKYYALTSTECMNAHSQPMGFPQTAAHAPHNPACGLRVLAERDLSVSQFTFADVDSRLDRANMVISSFFKLAHESFSPIASPRR